MPINTNTKEKKYSFEELEYLMKSYSDFCQDYLTAYYERSIQMPSWAEWNTLNNPTHGQHEKK